MSSLCPNLEMCIHFLFSVTFFNGLAFYFIEIIVLISWEGTPTQKILGIGSITFHSRGAMGVNLSYLCPKLEMFICILF